MKRLWKNRGGFTLVEIMVTFTLTTIFMGAATLVLTTFMRSHAVASAVATEQNVSLIVMDTITGNLGAARYQQNKFMPDVFTFPSGEEPNFTGIEDEKREEYSMLILNGADGQKVWYVDGETGNVVKMYLKSVSEEEDEKYLALDYYNKTGEPPDDKWEKVAEWRLGEGVYQGCSIKSFKVEVIKSKSNPSDPTSSLKITLVLENKKAGEEHNSYTLKRAVDCYNLAAENIAVLSS